MSVVMRHRCGRRRRISSRRWTSLVIVIALTAALVVAGAALAPTRADAAVRDPFVAVFNAQDNGAIALTGNSQLSCPTASNGCTAARGGTGNSDNLNNNAWVMGFVDADNDAST